MKITQSNKFNPNYSANVVSLPPSRKHSNADRLQVFTIDFSNVITDLSYKEGDLVVYFPVECKINAEFLSFINAFSKKELNNNKEISGFFSDSGRVRAIKLRGERSEGFVLKVSEIERFFNEKIDWRTDQLFDQIGDTIICEKYIIPIKPGTQKDPNKKVAKVNRLVDDQFRFHIDTENLRRNSHKIDPNDIISVSYKLHGTSGIWSNILVKRNLSWYEKILIKLGININKYEYDIVYSSRKVIKNPFLELNKSHFYDSDIWGETLTQIKDKIPPGITLYGEIVGFTKTGQSIQPKYDYGCLPDKSKLYIYRITFTNINGDCFEFNPTQIQEFCDKYGLLTPKLYYYGPAKDLFPNLDISNHWIENFILELEKEYNNKPCFMCSNDVPCEGIVVRKVNMFNYEAYKLKSPEFLQFETKILDENIAGMEE